MELAAKQEFTFAVDDDGVVIPRHSILETIV